LKPIVGTVVIVSPIFSLYKIVVLPAASIYFIFDWEWFVY